MTIYKPDLDSDNIHAIKSNLAEAIVNVVAVENTISISVSEKFPNHGRGVFSRKWTKCSHKGCYDRSFFENKCLFHLLKRDGFLKTEKVIRSENYSDKIEVSFQELTICDLKMLIKLMEKVNASNLTFLLCSFQDDIRLDGLSFDGNLNFFVCNFLGVVSFVSCDFRDGLSLNYSRFDKKGFSAFQTSFSDISAKFLEGDGSTLNFRDCAVASSVVFDGLSCAVFFSNSAVSGDIKAESASSHSLNLRNMKGAVKLKLADCLFGNVHISDTIFEECDRFGRFDCSADLAMYNVRFKDRVILEYSGGEGLRAVDTSMDRGGVFIIKSENIALINVFFGDIFALNGRGDGNDLPKLCSLSGSDVRKLHLANIDLSLCMLYAAVGLSEISIEMSVQFAKAPIGYSKRSVIADELYVRQNGGSWSARRWARAGGKDINDGRDMDHSDKTKSLLPIVSFEQVAIVYRMLKRAQDSSGNFPGGSDFYYGEMEMRRKSAKTRLVDRIVLSIYWFVSGYGLRAWRAFACFLISIVMGAVLSSEFAFEGGESDIVDGLIFALRASIPGLRSAEILTTNGQFLEIGLSLLGPVFLHLVYWQSARELKGRDSVESSLF